MERHYFPIAALAAFVVGCGAAETGTRPPIQLPLTGSTVLATVDGTPVVSGGYGSSLAIGTDSATFAILTDRGPNYEVGEDSKAFVDPGYSPRVGWFRRRDSTLDPIRSVALTNRDGTPITGLPNPAGQGGTGETALTPEGAPLAPDPSGLDPEGLHLVRDGTFWVSDEYGPHLVHFDSTGRTIERVSPFSTGRALPVVLSKRRPNRGMEGLTGSADGTVLVGLMQSPLDNPKAAGRASVHARLLVYSPATGESRQYLYPLDGPDFFTSDITLVRDQVFLVIEHDGRALGADPAATQKKVYRIDLTEATDVSDPGNAATGRLIGGKTLESLSASELVAAGIRVARKSLIADLLALGYPHDKPEGLVVLGRTQLGVINDDDFGITDGPSGRPVPKRLASAADRTDHNVLWVIDSPVPLW